MNLLLNYLAVMNWSGPFDDMFQNYFFYQRRSDGLWILSPWDLDLDPDRYRIIGELVAVL
jgi:spore coat protein CotH